MLPTTVSNSLTRAIVALFVLLSVVFGGVATAHAGESYPIEAPALVIDPSFCVGQRVTGHVEGAEPGSAVTVTMVFTLRNGEEVVRTVDLTADAAGRADFGIDFPDGEPQSVVVSASGGTAVTLDPFSFSNNVDLSECDELAETGSNPLPWLQLGGVVLGAGALLVVAAMRRRSQRPVTT